MAINLQSIQRGVAKTPPVISIHSDAGLGKSTFAANAPNPIFIPTENSLGKLDVERFPTAKSYEDVMNATASLLAEDHNYKTAVYDTLDWLEPMVWNYLIRQQPTDDKGRTVTNIEGYNYGKGFKYALDYWNEFISLTDRLRFEKDMMIIYIIHSTIRKVTPPDMDSYDTYMPKLQDSEKTSAKDKIVEHSDIVLFANWRVALTDEKLGFGNARNRGVGSGERIVYTEQRPAYEAKNRFSLPAQIPVKDPNWSDVWCVFSDNIPWFKQFSEPQPATKTAIPAANVQVAAIQAIPSPATVPAGETMPTFLTKPTTK